MKTYPNCVYSGIDWIGDIPEDWKILCLKRVSSIVNGSTPDSSNSDFWDGDINWVTPFDLGLQNGNKWIGDSSRKITSLGLNNCGASLTPKGSIILSTRAPIGHMAISIFETSTNQGCKTIVINQKEVDKVYLYFYLLANKGILQSLGQGSTFIELSSQNLKDFVVICPNLLEQKAIADYLDRKTAQIDTLIAKKQKQIDLLQEQRTATINQAVTKGLNPSVPMKDSGFDWLGEIPAHWNQKRIKYIAPRRVEQVKNDDERGLLLSLDSIESKTGRLIGNGTFEGQGNKFAKGDVLFCKLRPYLCKVIIAPQEGVAVSDLLVLNLSPEVEKRYLFYRMLESNFISVVDGSTYGAKMPRASWDFIGNLITPLPPFSEQRAIADFLDRKTDQIDNLSFEMQRSIDLLLEYRTSLISAVVTGKLDVRGGAE